MILSIIVPVYNVEAYLRKCADSLLDQDLPSSDYEIILVDDGSTDGSGHLCDSIAAGHNSIRVVHQQNKGLSAARNAGIAEARGKYIQFVDSDDYLNPNVLGGIINELESNDLDILRINYQNVNAAGEVFEPNKYSKPFVDYSEEVCDGLTFLNDRLGYACYAVQFVIKGSLLKKEGNGFKEGIYFEDVEWTPRLLLQANRVASCPTLVYNYLYRHDSITRNPDIEKMRKSIEDRLGLVSSLRQQGMKVSDSRWFDGMLAQNVLSVLADVSRRFFVERKQYIRYLKKLRVFPLSSYHTTSATIKKIRLANLSPELLCLAYHFKGGR